MNAVLKEGGSVAQRFQRLAATAPALAQTTAAERADKIRRLLEATLAARPAIIAADPVYKGDEAAFCKAYGAGDYAPDLVMPRQP